MPKSILKLICLLFIIVMASCAKRGNITGGTKDTIAPVLKASFPKNFSTNFNGKEIKLVFDEYVKLKNINKQLIISPPLKNQPDILPQLASKILTIKIKDTLQPNTTYSLNFGQSIEDNNEGNPYSQFKYVFSTGAYIDSLKINVKVKDALENKVDNFVSVMLYEINEKFNDSTIYKESPTYITNTLDSLKIVSIENIKAGKYLLVALKDNGNNKFNPKLDKIGFQKQYITIPNDTIFELKLFKEKLPFKALKPTQVSAKRLLMGYEGNPKNIRVTLKKGSEIIPNLVTKFQKKDSVQVWFKPLKTDSLQVLVEKDNLKKDFMIKLKKQKTDTLNISSDFNSTLPLRERFALNSNIPLVKFDKSKISVFNKDSVAVDFTTDYDEFEQKFYLNFKKEELEKYKIQLLPGALTDYYEKQNDTLKYSVATKNSSEYGNLKITLQNAKSFPVILELTDKDGKILATAYTENNPVVEFLALEPNKYTLRIIYDENKNGVWDSGNFTEKRQSEEVIYYPEILNVNANWDVIETFILK
ncbi:Ig-like domain-containing protein [Flavobacterium paronense]|uniref:Ig-like domain-containing protein n=1 Tax=Flavobacterium paronense TaxID=1392775 RepID=A0ABV5GFA6_9FLAO|nr:Ig-like domain-containing protein [Flavobacterium paronense]MDN3678580.1 Ig-like domain-containing protein [Flavobacterium paronense]